MARNGKIYLAKNIKMDKNYKSVLGYTEAQMLDLITNPSNLVYYQDDYSFIRDTGTIQISCKYSQAIQSNYIAFQNPDYSSKYFFAFVDEVKYLSENSSEIKYTVDVWTTWWEYWSYKACFVLREHVLDDTIGANTLPENVELGDYVLNDRREDFKAALSNYAICMAVTELPDGSVPAYTNHRNYNGIFGGLYYLGCSNATNCEIAIKMYDKMGKINAINSIFMIPISMTSYSDATTYEWTMQTVGTCYVKYLTAVTSADTIGTITTDFPTKIGVNYTPKNNKLYTYPYCYFNLTNNSGITESFRYEDFDKENGVPVIGFWVDAAITPGMSIKAIPLFYKNENINYNYGIVGGKLPICSFQSDVYLNWLRQNGLNSVFNVIGGIISTAAGIGTGNINNIIGGASNVYSALHQVTIADMTPNQAKGNTNAGDVNFSDEYCGLFTIYKMSIKDEYAKIIDDYFQRKGYSVNKLKVPNYSHRQNYNYIQIASEENAAYPNNHNNIGIPAQALDEINTMFRSGITIWNNHTNFGDYSVSNNITS